MIQGSDPDNQRCSDKYEDFLLTEYENIAKAFFDVKASVSAFFRYYLLVMSLPVSLSIAFFSKFDNLKYSEAFAHIYYIGAAAFIVLSIAGFLMTMYIISSGMNAKLYAEQVNAIREYFQSARKNCERSCYTSVLPTKRGEVEHDSKSLGYLFYATMMINSFYFFIAMFMLTSYVCVSIVIVFTAIAGQYSLYRWIIYNWKKKIEKFTQVA